MASLNLPRLTSPRFFAVHPKTGRALAFGSITFYGAGTTALRNVYSDRTGQVIAPNPVSLDAAGSCEVFLSGPYRIVVKDQAGEVVIDADRVNSTTVESSADNAGALLAANNLTDLLDASIAREALGIEKQATPGDATAGRLLAMGAFGLGAYAPAIEVSEDALDDINRVLGWVSVAAADAATVGAPGGASRGVCHTVRSANYFNQIYYPLAGVDPWPWRRMYVNGAWTPWIRDADYGGNSTGVNTWVRQAGGLQHAFYQAATFVYFSAQSLKFTWNFSQPWAAKPVITATLDSEGSSLTGLTAPSVGALRAQWVDADTCDVYLTRVSGAPDFVAGCEARNVQLHAVGRWSA